MATIQQELTAAVQFLSSHDLDSPREDAEVILAAATHTDRTYLLTHPEYRLTEIEQILLWRWLGKRAHHYPVQYLRGFQEFFGREFLVSPDVLIPRPETELLVEVSMKLFGEKTAGRVLDIGTGSGCIAITLLQELPGITAVATDISEGALKIARANARRACCLQRIQLLQTDIAPPPSGWQRKFDLVVSNPPYVSISDKDLVSPSVLKFEPPAAVFAPGNGLDVFRRLFQQLPGLLVAGGHLVVELGAGQSSAVRDLGRAYGWRQTDLRLDLANLERCAIFQRA
jgi:release factor glutamine methyltransferase